MSLGPAALVSHRAAAALYGLEGFDEGPLELTVMGERSSKLTGVRQHRSLSLRSGDIRLRGVFRTTRPERVLLDLAAVVGPNMLEVALDSALFKGLTTFQRLVAYVEAVRRPGLNGSGRLAKVLDRRDPSSAPAESFFETKLLPLPIFAFGRYPLARGLQNDETRTGSA